MPLFLPILSVLFWLCGKSIRQEKVHFLHCLRLGVVFKILCTNPWANRKSCLTKFVKRLSRPCKGLICLQVCLFCWSIWNFFVFAFCLLSFVGQLDLLNKMSQRNGREKNVFSVPVDQPEVCVIYFYFNRFGRRKSLFISFLAASLGAIGALLMTDKAEHDNGEKYSTITQSWAQTFKEYNFVSVKMPVNENARRKWLLAVTWPKF